MKPEDFMRVSASIKHKRNKRLVLVVRRKKYIKHRITCPKGSATTMQTNKNFFI